MSEIAPLEVVTPRDPLRFELAYQSDDAPWEISFPQPAVQALAAAEQIIGDVLDLGCGTGENALMLAARGHMVWGIDASPTAIEQARRKAQSRHVKNATFVLGSALELEVLGEGFHTVIDSGLFHTFSNQQREQYVQGLHHVMFPGSTLYLICFSESEPGSWGPRRVRRTELRELFTPARGFQIVHIERTRFELRNQGFAQALLATIRRAH